MRLKATEADVIEMGKLAVLASRPVGMGFLHHRDDLSKDDISFDTTRAHDMERGLSIDYYAGRMVKFHARKCDDGYEVADTISADYQSWIGTYPSYEALFAAATQAHAQPSIA